MSAWMRKSSFSCAFSIWRHCKICPKDVILWHWLTLLNQGCNLSFWILMMHEDFYVHQSHSNDTVHDWFTVIACKMRVVPERKVVQLLAFHNDCPHLAFSHSHCMTTLWQQSAHWGHAVTHWVMHYWLIKISSHLENVTDGQSLLLLTGNLVAAGCPCMQLFWLLEAWVQWQCENVKMMNSSLTWLFLRGCKSVYIGWSAAGIIIMDLLWAMGSGILWDVQEIWVFRTP